MNTALVMEMLATRATQGGNTALAESLARLQSDVNSNGANTQQLLATLTERNPLLAMVFRQLTDSSESRSESPAPVVEGESIELEAAPGDHAGSNAAIESYEEESMARGELQIIASELRDLRERMDALAAALGACALCWGRDQGCRACRGRGTPGYALPDESLFEEFVLPAVQLLRAHRIKQGRLAPLTPVTTAEMDGSPAYSQQH